MTADRRVWLAFAAGCLYGAGAMATYRWVSLLMLVVGGFLFIVSLPGDAKGDGP